MHISPTSISEAPPGRTTGAQQANQLAEWVYQGVTIAAMLLILCSLVVFW